MTSTESGRGKMNIHPSAHSRTPPFRDAEFEYGILPVPKWDEAQENYAFPQWLHIILFSSASADRLPPQFGHLILTLLTARLLLFPHRYLC